MPEASKRWPLLAALLVAGLAVGLGLDYLFASLYPTTPAAGLLRYWGEAAYYAGMGWLQVLVCVAIIIWARIRHDKPLGMTGLAGIYVIAVSGIGAQIIKHLIGRPRPHLGREWYEVVGPVFGSDLHSFPSGHAATSFALAAMLAQRFPKAAVPIYALAVLVSLGRVASRSHFPLDVLCGAALGLTVGLITARWVARTEKKYA